MTLPANLEYLKARILQEIRNITADIIDNIKKSVELDSCTECSVPQHGMFRTTAQNPPKLNAWCGIVDGRVIGSYFFQETLNGATYLDFFQNDLIPALITLFPDLEEPDIHQRDLFFQQDGAPPHYALPIRAYLYEVFPNRWIGRRGTIEWPVRSPDLNPLDYFLWGYLTFTLLLL